MILAGFDQNDFWESHWGKIHRDSQRVACNEFPWCCIGVWGWHLSCSIILSIQRSLNNHIDLLKGSKGLSQNRGPSLHPIFHHSIPFLTIIFPLKWPWIEDPAHVGQGQRSFCRLYILLHTRSLFPFHPIKHPIVYIPSYAHYIPWSIFPLHPITSHYISNTSHCIPLYSHCFFMNRLCTYTITL